MLTLCLLQDLIRDCIPVLVRSRADELDQGAAR